MEEAEAAAALEATPISTVAVEGTSTHIPQCCCGRTQMECPFLAQNNATLAALERDIQTAARLGQVSKFVETFLLISPALPASSVLWPVFAGLKTVSLYCL